MLPNNKSQYTYFYKNVVESLYFGQGDGEIFIAYNTKLQTDVMVTCIDISTLYREKRGKAIQLVETLSKFSHRHIVQIESYWIIPDQLIFIEMEMPLIVS